MEMTGEDKIEGKWENGEERRGREGEELLVVMNNHYIPNLQTAVLLGRSR